LYRIQRKWAAAVVIHVPDAILIPPCRTVLTQSLGPFFHMQTANCCPGTSRCAQTISNEWVLMWNMSQLAHRHQAASLVPSLLWQQGVVTYTSPVEAFAIGVKNLDRRKSSLIAWSLRSKTLDRLILREFKGQNVAMPAKYLRKCIDRLILVSSYPLIGSYKNIDCLIPFLSRLQTLLQVTSMWLPLGKQVHIFM